MSQNLPWLPLHHQVHREGPEKEKESAYIFSKAILKMFYASNKDNECCT